MVTRTWVGGGNNRANNPLDWSPNGLPQPGDLLTFTGSFPPKPYTMNVRGNDLAGDALSIYAASPTITLSNHATATVSGFGFSTATFNLSQNSTLAVGLVTESTMRVNLTGSDTLHFDLGKASTGIVTLAPNAAWHGSFTTGSGSGSILTVNGATGSTFDNNDLSHLLPYNQTTINADVTGIGEFMVEGRLEFTKSVGAGQSIGIPSLHDADHGIVILDQPTKFFGTVTMGFLPPASPNANQTAPEVDLLNLPNATSYAYPWGAVLEIFAGDTVIDSLKIGKVTNGFTVEKVGTSVHIVANSDPINHPVGLPLHV